MDQLFNNKYRIPSARLQNWNYASEAMYFVTICTKNMKNYFGEIIVSEQTKLLQANEIGQIAHSEWYKTIELRPDMNLELGEFVVMPNHIHGIIMIGANEYNTPRRDAMHRVSMQYADATHCVPMQCTDAMHRVSMQYADAMHCVCTNADADVPRNISCRNAMHHRDAMHCVSTNQFVPQSKNLSSIIRGYKSAVTVFARKNKIDFEWHPRFHDRIIRSKFEYHNISNYIINNPAKWVEDKFYQKINPLRR